MAQVRFLAALATRLLPEVFLPSAYVVIAGNISRGAYFIQRGRVEILQVSDANSSLLAKRAKVQSKAAKLVDTDTQVSEDYFGEIGLFLSRQTK